ncbi:MAG: IS3 family transposase [Spirochaetaceae bacterium]|nr:IS3 family transposase [Spirochaetaceae bacterium]
MRLIIRIFEGHRGQYGSPQVWQTLLQEFHVRVSRKRMERLMRKQGLKARKKKSGVNTTDSRHLLPVTENRLNWEFRASGPGSSRCRT